MNTEIHRYSPNAKEDIWTNGFLIQFRFNFLEVHKKNADDFVDDFDGTILTVHVMQTIRERFSYTECHSSPKPMSPTVEKMIFTNSASFKNCQTPVMSLPRPLNAFRILPTIAEMACKY
ncbi:unnamed protein product [Echinostoma caproni]|uniref:Uncharacterized protein n=1 Tax=Echinostoma caproni TaxID=27848 RepID=A0A183AEJ4_9TREM|nr:unnamed protein product [Echinostoma caproni]